MNWRRSEITVVSFLTLGLLSVILPLDSLGQEVSKRRAENERASAYFANAADYQNAGAFELAAEEWEKLIQEFPDEAQVSTAWHHLGICCLRRKEPDLKRAMEAFRQALKDSKLELREESLINLGWVLLSQSRSRATGSEMRKKELSEARGVLTEFLKSFSDGAYLDQATFYLGEIEYSLGNQRRAIEHYKSFLGNKELTQSPLRADVVYALAVAFDEQKQASEALRRYQEFLSDFGDHSLSNEVRLRLAELLSSNQDYLEAYRVLSELTESKDAKFLDLAVLRRGAVGLQLGKLHEAATDYRGVLNRNLFESLGTGTNAKTSERNSPEADSSKSTESDARNSLSADAAHGLALALMRQGKYSETTQLLESVIDRIQNYDRRTLLRLDLADALLAQPELKSEARSLFERIASENLESPLAARAVYNVAFMALEAEQTVEAQRWAEQFLNRYPNDPLRSDVAFIAAESLLRQGQHSGAVQAFSKLIDADSQNENQPQWKLRLGMALFLDGKYAAAVQEMQGLEGQLSLNSQRAEALFISGASQLYLEKPSLAVQDLQASYEIDRRWEKSDETLLILGEAYQRSGDPAAAQRTYERLLSDLPNSRLKAQTQYKLAQLTASDGDLQSALSQYRAIADDPQAASFHNFSIYGVAWCLMQQGNFRQALAELKPLLGKKLQDSIGSEALLAEGICLRNIGRSADAVESLQRFLDRQPSGQSLANGLYELALAQAAIKKIDQANLALQRIITEVPEYPGTDKVLYELAWNHQEQDQIQMATEKFESLFERYPSSPLAAEARYMVAQYDYDSGKYEQAISGYRQIIGTTNDQELLEKALYKLGWSLFEAQDYDDAAKAHDEQIEKFPSGALAVDGLFMRAECDFKQDRFEEAFAGFQRARNALENSVSQDTVSPQVKTLIYLHGAQCLRELKRWNESSQWLKVIIEKQAGSPYLPTAIYELGFCKQNLGKFDEAILHYSEVANNYRSEIAARARFMLGEIYFSQKDFEKAIPEFQRVMYGFGGEKAPDEIKKWQAKSAFEAARCSEALIQTLNGSARKKIVETTIEFYRFLVDKHSAEVDLTAQAQTRLGELQKLR